MYGDASQPQILTLDECHRSSQNEVMMILICDLIFDLIYCTFYVYVFVTLIEFLINL